MLMYEDGGITYSVLEKRAFLPIARASPHINRADLRLASCLKRLRGMTRWVPHGADIDKRCNEAIVVHVELRPSLRTFYGSAVTY